MNNPLLKCLTLIEAIHPYSPNTPTEEAEQ